MPSLQARMIARSALGHATQDPLELAEFLDVLLADPPRTIVEVGVAFGGTLQAWSQVATDDALLIGVDIDTGGAHYELRQGQSAVLIEADSQKQPETVWAVRDALGGREVDFLFIDGLHTEEAARNDYLGFLCLVRSGGIVAFHDVAGNDGVKRFWEQIEGVEYGNPEKHLIHNAAETRHCMGIGWLRVA